MRLSKQRLAIAEVLVDGGDRHVCRLGDIAHAQALTLVLLEQSHTGVQDLLTRRDLKTCHRPPSVVTFYLSVLQVARVTLATMPKLQLSILLSNYCMEFDLRQPCAPRRGRWCHSGSRRGPLREEPRVSCIGGRSRVTITPWLHHDTPHPSALVGEVRGSGSRGPASPPPARRGRSSSIPKTAWVSSDVILSWRPSRFGRPVASGLTVATC